MKYSEYMMNKTASPFSLESIGTLWNKSVDAAKLVLLAGLGISGVGGYMIGRGTAAMTAKDPGDYKNAGKEYKLNRLRAENNRIEALMADEAAARGKAQPPKSMRIQ